MKVELKGGPFDGRVREISIRSWPYELRELIPQELSCDAYDPTVAPNIKPSIPHAIYHLRTEKVPFGYVVVGEYQGNGQ